MLAVLPDLTCRCEAWLAQQNIIAGRRPHYHRWLRYYLDFCHKCSSKPMNWRSLPAFQEKLRTRHQPEPLCQQAGQAVALYLEMVSSANESCPPADAATQQGVVETRLTAQVSLERVPSHPSPTGKSPTTLLTPPSLSTMLDPQRAEKATLYTWRRGGLEKPRFGFH